MAKTFGEAERHILKLFKPDAIFHYDGNEYTVLKSGKPTCSSGEPKTDIYVCAKDLFQNDREFKISFKKENADFLENKTNAQRAAQLFGEHWDTIISESTSSLKSRFEERMLIYKEKLGRTERGAITLGWKFELLNVESGNLSGAMHLTKEQVVDVYAGTHLSVDKKDATVNGELIEDSGVANFILFEDQPISNIQEAANSLISIEDYVNQHPDVYFACKALNYRTFAEKYDGNRPLAVAVDWSVNNGKLSYNICYEDPLKHGGDEMANRLKTALNLLNVHTTDDLNESNVEDLSKMHLRN